MARQGISVQRRALNADSGTCGSGPDGKGCVLNGNPCMSASGGDAGGDCGRAARSAHAGIAVQNAALSIWTGAAGTGIGIQGTTLDGNTLPSHAHTSIQPSEYRDNGWGDSGNITFRGPTQKNGGYTGNSWAHAHGVSDPGHAHAVGSSEHNHGVTDSGHTHALTAQAISTMPPYYALCLIIKL